MVAARTSSLTSWLIYGPNLMAHAAPELEYPHRACFEPPAFFEAFMSVAIYGSTRFKRQCLGIYVCTCMNVLYLQIQTCIYVYTCMCVYVCM